MAPFFPWYCPYCGNIQKKTNTVCFCCGREMQLIQFKKDTDYYSSIAKSKCAQELGDEPKFSLDDRKRYEEWFNRKREIYDQLILEEEIIPNSPLYDPTIETRPYNYREDHKDDPDAQIVLPASVQKKIDEKNCVPRCPTCGSTNVEKISVAAKAFSLATIGLLSSTVRSQFKCKKCGYKW